MEKFIYSNLGQKMNRTHQEKRDSDIFTLKDFLENKWIIQNSDELKKVFIKDLKSILLEENLFNFIQRFFDLEQDLTHAMDRLDFEAAEINFDEFYKNLAPVLMRALLEISSQRDNAGVVLKTIKESLRIALEEELYRLEDHLV